MKENAQDPNVAPRTSSCPKCQGVSFLIAPSHEVPKNIAVYGCKSCGLKSNFEGKAIIASQEDFSNISKMTKLASELVNNNSDENLGFAAKSVLLAEMVSYGMNMWYDGLKQGLLLAAVEESIKNDGKTRD